MDPPTPSISSFLVFTPSPAKRESSPQRQKRGKTQTQKEGRKYADCDHVLSSSEQLLLAQGLTFAPTAHPNPFTLFLDLNRFVRNIMVKHNFNIQASKNSNSNSKIDNKLQPSWIQYRHDRFIGTKCIGRSKRCIYRRSRWSCRSTDPTSTYLTTDTANPNLFLIAHLLKVLMFLVFTKSYMLTSYVYVNSPQLILFPTWLQQNLRL